MSKTIQTQVEEAVGVSRLNYPLTHPLRCPFAQGTLNDRNRIRLMASDGVELPLQTTVLSHWPDGSIKWLLLDAQVSLRPKQVLPLQIEYGEDVTRAEVNSPLKASPTADELRVETGALTVDLNRSGPALIAQVERSEMSDGSGANGCLIDDGQPQMSVTMEDGTRYTSHVEHLEVEEQNALRLVVKAQGGFVSANGARSLSWLIRLYFFAHQPFVKMYHTFVHDADEPLFFRMREMKFRLPLAIESPPRVMMGSPHTTTHLGDDFDTLCAPVMLWENDFEQYSILVLLCQLAVGHS